MFVNFFAELKAANLPVTLKEYLMLMEAMDKHVASGSVDDFYYLSRAALVKDERNLDKFDQVFGHVFKGLEALPEDLTAEIPEEWLRKLSEKFLTEEEKQMIESLGGWEQLMENAQKNAWKNKRNAMKAAANGSALAAPLPLAPMAITRKGCASAKNKAATAGRSRSGTSVSTRTSMIPWNWAHGTSKSPYAACAKFAREGAETELDLDDTIRSTAHKGYLDIKMVPERPQHGESLAVL